MARLYVGNLDSRVSERDLEDEFRAYGVIRSVWVARRPPGYAFIDFDDRRDAQDAIRAMDGKNGWRVELSHNSSGGRGGGGSGRGRSSGSDLKCYECVAVAVQDTGEVQAMAGVHVGVLQDAAVCRLAVAMCRLAVGMCRLGVGMCRLAVGMSRHAVAMRHHAVAMRPLAAEVRPLAAEVRPLAAGSASPRGRSASPRDRSVSPHGRSASPRGHSLSKSPGYRGRDDAPYANGNGHDRRRSRS
ncbi:hypothetical protein MLD38_006415 [Melastoma candidum]|uniref:Uncharacterized protein n=1 Tax=Melastoma candidum TaxID=119954 RepID=A0ACB9RQU0_9MYRT|nr:hypothetical protein MLD38_006415 [Melastoma candidum]